MKSKSISIPLFVGGLVLLVVITASGIFFVLDRKAVENTTTESTNTTLQNEYEITPVSSTIAVNSAEFIETKYKDGTYQVSATYLTPGEPSTIDLNLSIENDTITEIEVTHEESGDSERNINRFANGISGVIVGQKVDNSTLSQVVNGASLTTAAFNKALEKIKQEAIY